MADAVRKLFGSDVDHEQALAVAQKISVLLKSRIATNEKIIIGQPFCPFKVSLHAKEFHCFLFISDASYYFTAKTKPDIPFVEDFRVSLKKPDPVGGARVLAPQISKVIGISLYGLPRCPDDALDIAFTSKPLLSLMRRINFNRVHQFHFSPVRLDVIASLDTPEFCAEQALVFRDLLAWANQEALERNRSLLD